MKGIYLKDQRERKRKGKSEGGRQTRLNDDGSKREKDR